MVSINYCFRASSRGKSYEGKIYLRIIHQRQIRTVTTSFCLFSYEWDQELHAPIPERAQGSRCIYLRELALRLSFEQKRLLSIANSLKDRGLFSVADMQQIIRQSLGASGKGLKSFTESLSQELISSGHDRTAAAYRTALRRLLGYTGGEDLSFPEITSSLIGGFEKYMRQQNRSLNTISFYMRNLRAIFNKAIRRGLIYSPLGNPFTGVYTGVQISRKRAISKDEMSRLNRLLESPEPLLKKEDHRALAMFLFSFHTRGMSFVDMAYLRKEDLKDNSLSYIRKKTGQLLEIQVNNDLRRLIRYFSKDTVGSPYLLPVLQSNPDYLKTQYKSALRMQNRRLKKVAGLAGIGKNLSTHVARHSWATIAKGENIPLRVISECLGHTSEKTTQIYLASFERSILDKANDKVIRAVKKTV